MKRILVVVLLIAGLTVVAFASFTNKKKVVAEKNKTIAKLDDGISGTCFISTKAKLPNNIQAMDQET